MGNDRHFESTYVGHFVSDGISFNLRPASSGRSQSMSYYRSNTAKPSTEHQNIALNTQEMSSPMPSRSNIANSTPQISHLTPTRTHATQRVPTSLPESSRKQPSSTSQPERVPIWRRGTIARPVTQSPESQTSHTVRRVQSQATILGNIPPRRSSLAQNLMKSNIASEQSTTVPMPTVNRTSIRTEMTAPRRTFSMPSIAATPVRNQVHRSPQATISRERKIQNTSILNRNLTSTKQSSTGPGTSTGSAPAGRRELGESALGNPPLSPLSARLSISTGAVSETVARATTSARTIPIQRTPLARPSYPRELRYVPSQSQLHQSNTLSIKPSRKGVTENTSLAQRKEKGRIQEEGECCVCMNARSDTALYRCGHVCACMPCANELKQCPICREQVTDVIKIWKI